MEQDLEEEVVMEDDLVTTNGPVSLFKIINEIYEMTGSRFNLKAIGYVLCKYSQSMLCFY